MMLQARRGLAFALPVTMMVALGPSFARADPTEPNTLTNPLFRASECESCHGFANPGSQANDPTYSAFWTWQGTMMANAARDPVFWAGVAIAAQDQPGETQDCIRCHAPRAFLEGRGEATSIGELEPEDFDSVTCELCHRSVEDAGIEPGNARYTIDDTVVDGLVPRRGPWAYDDGIPAPPHSFLFDTYLGSSRLCGTCHDVTTGRERVDARGEPSGAPFNEQRTYSEWLNSAFSQPGDSFRSCQDCHMPAVPDKVGCSQNLLTDGHPTGGRRHDLVGANRFMLQVLQSLYGDEGTGELDSGYFDVSIARTDELLATAATVEVEAPDTIDLREGVSALTVRVTNNTGHKLPSGYSEGRVMWLEFVATYGESVVYSSGRWDSAALTIEEDPNLRRYEAIAVDWATGETFHLLRNNHWQEDSRIPPLGLTPDPETDPIGGRYALLEDGTWPNFDEHTYTFAPRPDVVDQTPGEADELQVTVRLLYLINTQPYIEFLADENSTNQAGVDLATLFDAEGGAQPVVLAEATTSIPLTGLMGDGSDSGTSSSTGGADGSTGDPEGTTTEPPDSTQGSESSGSAAIDGPSEGCGCVQGGSNYGMLAGLALLPLFGRRRRKSSVR